MIEVSSEKFRWEAAHVLMNHKGKCRNNHGHNYRAQLTLAFPHVDKATGMGIDFGDFKCVQEWIDENWDHSTILNPADEARISFHRGIEDRVFVMPWHCPEPTAENLARLLAEVAQELLFPPEDADDELLGSDGVVSHAKVWETPELSATYYRD